MIKEVKDIEVQTRVIDNSKDYIIKQLQQENKQLKQEIEDKNTSWESLKYYIEKLYYKDYIEEAIFDDICKKVNELETGKENKTYQKEVVSLTSILTELEEWLEEENTYSDYKDITYRETMGYVLDKIQELKEKYK